VANRKQRNLLTITTKCIHQHQHILLTMRHISFREGGVLTWSLLRHSGSGSEVRVDPTACSLLLMNEKGCGATIICWVGSSGLLYITKQLEDNDLSREEQGNRALEAVGGYAC